MAFGSKKLLAPKRTTTQLDVSGVVAAVEGVVEALNEELRRKEANSWISRKLGYDAAEAERQHLRYLCHMFGDTARVSLNARSSNEPPKWEAVISMSSSTDLIVVELKLLRLDLDYKFTYTPFADALRAAL